jgi:hypothetical protein
MGETSDQGKIFLSFVDQNVIKNELNLKETR